MGLELTTDRYPPITSQTRYPLRHRFNNNIDRLLNQQDNVSILLTTILTNFKRRYPIYINTLVLMQNLNLPTYIKPELNLNPYLIIILNKKNLHNSSYKYIFCLNWKIFVWYIFGQNQLFLSK